MKDTKECEKLLKLTDAMVHVHGILLIEQGLKMIHWSTSCPKDSICLKNKLLEKVIAEVGIENYTLIHADIIAEE